VRYTYRYRWAIFVVLAGIYFFVYFHRMSSAVIARELMDEFAVSAVAIGVMSSAYFYPYAALQIPVGMLSDTVGSRKTATVFTFMAFIGATLFGLSSTFSMAVGARVLMGIGVSGVYIPTLKILSQWFRKQEFASLTGVLLAVGNFGALSASYPLAMMVIFFGWRTSFFIIGLITLILAILCWVVVRDSPKNVGVDPVVVEEEHKEEKIPPLKGVKSVLTNKYFWPLAIWFFFEYGVIAGFQGLWGGPFFLDVYGMSKAQTGVMLMMVGFGMIIGAPLIGVLSDRVFRTRKWMLVGCTIGMLVVWFPFAFLTEKMSIPHLYILNFAMGVFGSALILIFTSTKELFPLQITGIATSMVNIFPFIGGAIFQTVMGYLMDTIGKVGRAYPSSAYALAFKFTFVAIIVALVVSIFVKETMDMA